MPEEPNVYDEMGDFYDFVYSEDFDSDFYLKEAKACKGKVLELGCGTGRITVRLLKEGIDITGLDMSEKMIELLERKAGKEGLKAKTHLGSMTDFKIDDRFKLAIFPYRSFLHLLSTAEREKTLANIYSHLEKGGKIILHIYNPSEQELDCTDTLHKIDEHTIVKEGKKYTMKWFLRYYPEKGTADYAILVFDETGREVNKFEMTIFFVTPDELKALLEKTGFKNITTYCGFEYEDYDGMCQEIVMVAEK